MTTGMRSCCRWEWAGVWLNGDDVWVRLGGVAWGGVGLDFDSGCEWVVQMGMGHWTQKVHTQASISPHRVTPGVP